MTLMSWSAQRPRSGGETPQWTAVGPQEFSRQSRQLDLVKALTRAFVGQLRQLTGSKAQHVVRALLRRVGQLTGLTVSPSARR
jgi:hypothetical protein